MKETIELKEESLSYPSSLTVLGLFVFATFLAFWGLSSGPCLTDHEAIVAQAARQMRLDGNWLVPHIGDEPFIRKPPMAVWLVAAASWLVDPAGALPVSPFAARLPSALASVLTTMLVYRLGRSMFGERIGLVCGGIMAVCAGSLYFSHNAQVEMVLTFFCTACFACFWWATHDSARSWRHWLLGCVCFSLALLSKAPLPIAIVILPLGVWWFLTIPLAALQSEDRSSSSLFSRIAHQVKGVSLLQGLVGIAVATAIFVPWPYYIYMKVENALDLWQLEFLDRFTGDLGEEPEPFWFYLPFLLLYAFPFSLSVPEAFASSFQKKYARNREGLLFAFTWATVQVLFLSASAFKRPHYLIGAIPALALLLGPTIDRFFLAAKTVSAKAMKLGGWTVFLGVPAAFIVGAFVLKRELPALLRMYFLLAAVSIVGCCLVCDAYLRGKRLLSIALLHVTAAFSFALLWEGVGQSRAFGAQPLIMVEELRARSIGINDRVTWVVGRPDARLIYYAGHEIQPLFTALELASKRDDRKSIPQELWLEGVSRLEERLKSNQEEYFIIDAKYWNQLTSLLGTPPSREVVRVPGDDPRGKDDWLVLTNAWNVGEDEDHSGDKALLSPLKGKASRHNFMARGDK